MPQLYVTSLKPAAGGFGVWEWVEPYALEGCETYADYEGVLNDGDGMHLCWAVTDALAGRIREERGRVYRLETAPEEFMYEMVWIDPEEL